jgi:hypothetical protein
LPSGSDWTLPGWKIGRTCLLEPLMLSRLGSWGDIGGTVLDLRGPERRRF